MGRKKQKPETVYERDLRELQEYLGPNVTVVGNPPSRPHVALTEEELRSFRLGMEATVARLRAKYGKKEA